VADWQNLTTSKKAGKFWAIQCGSRSGLVVIDVDVADDGVKYFNELVKNNPPFETTIIKTPSGGMHYYFKYRTGLKNSVKINIDGVPKGIDVRTDGGCVMGYGSKGYQIESSKPMIDMPDWLFDIVKPARNESAVGTKRKRDENMPEDIQVKKALELFNELDHAPNHGEIHSITDDNGKILIILSRVYSSNCSFCSRIHQRDNSAMILICPSDDKIMYGCVKSPKNMKFLGNIGHPPSVKKVEKKIKGRTKRNKLKNSTRFNEKYCSNHKDLIRCKSRMLCIKSPTGTGKTNAVAEILKERKPDRVLVSTFRVNQVSQLKNDKFKDIPNLISYNETRSTVSTESLPNDTTKTITTKVKLDNSQKAIICQAESLHRIRWTEYDKNKTTVVLDEACQVKKQFTSETFLKQPTGKRSWKKFKQILKNAEYVYVMDAHLTQDVISWIQSIGCIKQADTQVFINEYLKPNEKKIDMTLCPYDVLKDCKRKLKKRKRIYIACNCSIEKIDAYAVLLQKFRPNAKILKIHQETLNDPDVLKAMENINDPKTGWGAYDVLIVSPSIQSGLSFDAAAGSANAFDSVFGIFSNYTNASNDCIQMLDRVRHPNNDTITISISMTNNNIGPTTEKGVINSLKSKTAHLYKINQQLEALADFEFNADGGYNFARCDYFDLYVSNVIHTNRDRENFMFNLLQEEQDVGFTINRLEGMKQPEKDAWKKKVKEIVEKLRDGNAKDIADVITVDELEIEKIKEKINTGSEKLTKDELLNLKKNSTLKLYKIKEDAIPKKLKNKWFREYGEKKVKKAYVAQRRIFSFGNFDDALAELKKYEISKASNIGRKYNDDEDFLTDPIDMAISVITTNFKYKKWNLVLNWLKDLGFDSLNSDKVYPHIDMYAKLEKIRDSLTSDDFYILDKRQNKLKSILKDCQTAKDNEAERRAAQIKQDAGFEKINQHLKNKVKGFTTVMLGFLNGAFRSEFGVSVVMEKKGKGNNKPSYYLSNRYLSNKELPRFELNATHEKNGKLIEWIPLLEKNCPNRDFLDKDPYDSDDDSDSE
jgi:hypothetical protein